MSRKHQRRDYNGRQGSAQRPWEQEQADWQNRGSMQRSQYDNIGRDRYGSNTGQGGGYGSRDWDRGDDGGSRPDWPGEQRSSRQDAGRYGGGSYGSGNFDQNEEYGEQRYGRGESESRRYRSQGYGGDQGMSRYQGERSGGYGQNYGNEDDREDRAGSERNFEEGRWYRNQGSQRDQPWGNQSGYGSQQSDSRQYGRSYEGQFGASQSGAGQSSAGMGQNYGASQSNSRRDQGGHSGRGPKGYRRGDERIQEEINEELTRHPGIDASEIEVKVSNGEVTLTGTVDNREAKRMAEDAAEGVSGVTEVQNQIRVQKTVGSARSDEDHENGGSSRSKNRAGSTSGSNSSTSGSESGSRNRTGTGVGA